MISGFWGRQPTGDINHKPSSRLSLLPARSTVTIPVSECHHPWLVPMYTAWWTEAHLCEQLAYGHCGTAERPRIERKNSIMLDQCATKTHARSTIIQNRAQWHLLFCGFFEHGNCTLHITMLRLSKQHPQFPLCLPHRNHTDKGLATGFNTQALSPGRVQCEYPIQISS